MIFITRYADSEGLQTTPRYMSKDDIFDEIRASWIEVNSIYQNKTTTLSLLPTGNADSTIDSTF